MQNRRSDQSLEEIADQLSPTEAQSELAVKRYKSIGDWLNRPESSLKKYAVEVSPQGSFNLGTTVRPLGDSDSFDLDLVCKVGASKIEFSQSELKQLVGNEMREYCKANNIKAPITEGKRCWTIEYADTTSFHIDILPAIPDDQAILSENTHIAVLNDERAKIYGNAIAITDNTSASFTQIPGHWPVSNPNGYALWFSERQKVQSTLLRERIIASDSAYATVEQVPDHKVKTTLQRAIQLLKRHRDQMFGDDEFKPISIIITTLSAHAYRNESDLSGALKSILMGMDTYIEVKNGEKWIANPSNPKENFADRWVGCANRESKFYDWLEQARRDFGLIAKSSGANLKENLSRAFSDATASKVAMAGAVMTPAVKSAAAVAKQETDYISSVGQASKPWASSN